LSCKASSASARCQACLICPSPPLSNASSQDFGLDAMRLWVLALSNCLPDVAVCVQALFVLTCLVATLGEQAFYGDRVDPWDTSHIKTWSQPDGNIMQVEVRNGKFSAAQFNPATQEVNMVDVHAEEVLRLGIPPDAFEPPVAEAEWAERRQWDGRPSLLPIDTKCPRRGEGHLQKSTVEVLQAIGNDGVHHRAVNIGGLYGAGARETADDPIVEAVRWDSEMQVLCINCGDLAAIARLDGHRERFATVSASLAPDTDFSFIIPEQWREVDVLRLEQMPGGTSCPILRSILRVLRPRVVVLIVHAQIPPPIQLSTLRATGSPELDEVFYSCSLSAAASVLRVAGTGMSLLRLSGPYALFVRDGDWTASALPLDEQECFRHVEVWGVELFPISFVRDWLFDPQPLRSLLRIHGNVTGVFATYGLPREPFALAV